MIIKIIKFSSNLLKKTIKLILVITLLLSLLNLDLFLNKKETKAELSPYKDEYFIDIGPVAGTATANYVYASLFNTLSSGRTILIKRILIRAFANGTGNYVNLTLRRITNAFGGTQILASEIPKKNNYSSDPVLDVRYAGPSVTFAGTANSRILSQAMPGAAGQWHSIRDIKFENSDEPIVLQPGEGIALYQEAAGTTAHIIRLYIEWEEIDSANTPTAQNEYLFAFPRVENAGAANYVYHSFFNPAGSGRTAIIKRIWFGAETCDTTAVYTNNLVIRRISAASLGTQIPAADIPKKHTGSSNSAMDLRHTGVTVTQVGGADARLAMVTPCADAGQPQGFMYLNFDQNDEKLILQPGEGIALIADTAGDIDQLIRLVIEWQEVTNAPSAQNEYLIALGRVEATTTANQTYFTFFNPSGSGKAAVVKRLVIRNDADTGANYAAFTWRRISTTTGGLLIAATDIPKKHTGSLNSAMEIRWCGGTCATAITATYVGTADSRILTVNGPGTIGQIIGHREIVFGNNEKLILQQGEGIGFYIETAGDVDHYIKVMIEWQEATTPTAQNEYLIDIGPISGSTAANYVYASLFNPSASGKNLIVKRVNIRVDTAAAAVYIPMTLRKISTSTGGTQILAANIPKKHSGSPDSVADVKRTGVTVTFVGSADARLVSVQTPGAVAGAAAPSLNGYQELIFKNDEKLILKPGEGIALYQEAAGDVDFRVKILIEWQETTTTPNSEGEYIFYTGPITGNTSINYVYSSFFNPLGSDKNYLIKRIGIRVDRNTAAVAPTYIPISIRKVNSATNGTLISSVDILPKNSSTTNSTVEIRTTNPTVSFVQNTHSRLLGVTQAGAVNQNYGIYHIEIIFQDELMIAPGEGFALYQETAPGDAGFRVRLEIEWSEIDITYNQSAYRFFNNLDSTDVGSPLAAQDTSITLSSPGQVFRLRLLIHISTGTLSASGQNFKLQFGTSTGSNCGPFSLITWSDVTTSSIISFYDNPTPTDGSALTANANDPTHGADTIVNQTYEELNNFTNSQAAIPAGQDGKWDFSLKDNSAPANTTYCLRVVKANGVPLNTYSVIPQITTAAAPSLTCTFSATSTDFSSLSPSAVSTSSPDITITITSSGAFQITVKDAGNGTSPGLYKSTSPTYLIQSTDATLTAGTDGYGIQATTTNANITINPKYNKSGNDVGGLSLTDIQLASSTVSVSSAQINVKHKAAASYLAPTGNYSDTITYSCSTL
ncbi:MAG: hypothetical protein QXG91_04805 [Candidatus Aenigmatarchaeota archaeon]